MLFFSIYQTGLNVKYNVLYAVLIRKSNNIMNLIDLFQGWEELYQLS